MLNKIFIIDFEDSFTHNIAAELYQFEEKTIVIPHQIFFKKNYFNTLLNSFNDTIAIVLGPGPGHPRLYGKYFRQILQLKNNKKIYLMGICLGHQLIAVSEGYSIKKAKEAAHGISNLITFKKRLIKVQRYNSLSVYQTLSSNIEINFRNWNYGVSYQFHPESVGTSNTNIFFKELLGFIDVNI